MSQTGGNKTTKMLIPCKCIVLTQRINKHTQCRIISGGAMHLGFYYFTTASFRHIKRERETEWKAIYAVVSLTESGFFGPYPSLARWLSFTPRRRSALVNKWEKLGRSLISTYARMNKSTATDAPLIHELISHASMHITSKFVLNTMHSTHTHTHTQVSIYHTI